MEHHFRFDATFLLLSEPSTEASIGILDLVDFLCEIGFECKIATHPTQLALRTAKGQQRIIVVDGTDNSEFDIHTLVAALRGLPDSFIVLLTDSDPSVSVHEQDVGADLYLSLRSQTGDLATTLVAHLEQRFNPETDVRIAP